MSIEGEPERKARRKPANTKRTKKTAELFTKGRKLPIVRCLKDDTFVAIEWNDEIGDLLAKTIQRDQIRALVDKRYPPKVVGISGDPDHVLLFLWDPKHNHYDNGEKMTIDDPRLPRAHRR